MLRASPQLTPSSSLWVIGTELKPLNDALDYLHDAQRFSTDDVMPNDSLEVSTEKLRQRAYRTDANCGGDHTFFANAIERENEARKLRQVLKHKDVWRRQRRCEENRRRQEQRGIGGDKHRRHKLEHRHRHAHAKRPYELDFSSETSEDRENNSSEDTDEELFVSNASQRPSGISDTNSSEKKRRADEVQRRIRENFQQGFWNMKG